MKLDSNVEKLTFNAARLVHGYSYSRDDLGNIDLYQSLKTVTHGPSFETRSLNAPQDKDRCIISTPYPHAEEPPKAASRSMADGSIPPGSGIIALLPFPSKAWSSHNNAITHARPSLYTDPRSIRPRCRSSMDSLSKGATLISASDQLYSQCIFGSSHGDLFVILEYY